MPGVEDDSGDEGEGGHVDGQDRRRRPEWRAVVGQAAPSLDDGQVGQRCGRQRREPAADLDPMPPDPIGVAHQRRQQAAEGEAVAAAGERPPVEPLPPRRHRGRQQRQCLGAVVRELIEARGRVVSVGAIVDAVWGGAPPDDATGAVQALVSRVRRLGLPVRGATGGYRVPTDEVSVDAVAARSLVERARRALTAGEVVAAAGLGDEARALFPEVPDLTEPGRTLLFADVTAVRVEAALAGGTVGSAGGPTDLARTEDDLRRLVAGIPPHEPAAVLLVRALAAQGREAEALETIDRLRLELAQRYGTDVSPALARVRMALLRQELAAPRHRRPPRPWPPPLGEPHQQDQLAPLRSRRRPGGGDPRHRWSGGRRTSSPSPPGWPRRRWSPWSRLAGPGRRGWPPRSPGGRR